MSDSISAHDYTKKIPDFYKLDSRVQTDYIAYYISQYKNISPFNVIDLDSIFQDELSIRPHGRLAQYLSEEAKKRGGKYIKAPKGYKLSGNILTHIAAIVEGAPEMTKLNDNLASLMASITDSNEQVLLSEAAKCYQVKANRAAMVLIWIVVLYHLQKHVFTSELKAFNTALAKSPDARVKKVVKFDDFSDLKEVKFIELLRSAGVVTNDVRKILDTRLGERNSAAHPSTIVISSHKAVDYGQDLIANVLLKY